MLEKERRKLNFIDLKVEYNKQSDKPISEDLKIENVNSLLTNTKIIVKNAAENEKKHQLKHMEI